MVATNPVFRSDLLDPARCSGWQKQFGQAQPIRHLVVDHFLNPDFARSLFVHFPSIETMKTHYRGLNEEKAEHSDFSHLHPAFVELHQQLTSPVMLEWLQKVTGIPGLQTIEDRLGYGLHQGANQSFLDIHIDYNLHPLRKLYRKLNLIIFLNESWESNWGGHLELWDADVANCVQSIAPVFNRCALFECSEISYHGYNRISVPEGVTRKSAYQYYFVPAPAGVSFHDTIFKPRPEDSSVKKLRTYSKDWVKNMAKKTLLQLGMKKWLR